ncbi:potassium channel subfamily K member 13a isoform X2 [Heptranchias perlo]|uniref:potassium channel subfamily K member 13a isoform X2 n=1 Tax=Heptranchias perlo TaxID=212740 RepID=UPI00355A2AE3
MAGRGGCYCHLNEDNARFALLALLIALYLVCGAAVFSAIEQPKEKEAHRQWLRRKESFAQRYNISWAELRNFLRDYEEANVAGVRVSETRPRWDFTGSFYFVGTVVSTIGFGMTTPATVSGKIFLIFYGLIGCAATILFFNLFLERLITLLAYVLKTCHERQLRRSGVLPQRNCRDSGNVGEVDSLAGWKPSVYYVMLILGLAAIVISCCASAMYTPVEGWSYLDSIYFCFVAFSTIGFGDLVSSQNTSHKAVPQLDPEEVGMQVLPQIPKETVREVAGECRCAGREPHRAQDLHRDGCLQRERGGRAATVRGDDLHAGLLGGQQGLAGRHAEAAVGDGQRASQGHWPGLPAQRLLRGSGGSGHHEQ